MHRIGSSIIFFDLQLRRGNNTKKIKVQLEKSLMDLKKISSDEMFDDEYDSLFTKKAIREFYMTGNLFPKDMSRFFIFPEPGYTNDIRVEVRWNLKLFSKYYEVINEFVQAKEDYDELIIEGKYEAAFECLKAIENKTGLSLWLLENKIFLLHMLKQDVSEVLLKSQHIPFVQTVLKFYDMKSSEEMLSRDYNYIVRREIEKFKRINPDMEETIALYTYFIAPYLFQMDDEGIRFLLKGICKMPLIDRYLSVIDILERYVAEATECSAPEWLVKNIEYMDGITDTTVITYRFLLSSKIDRPIQFDLNDGLIEERNLFVQGQTDACYELIKSKIEDGPIDIRRYNLYIEICQIKNLKICNLDISENKKCVLENLHKIYSFSEDYNDAIDSIYKICFWSFHAKWARDIYNQITRHVQPLNSNEYKTSKKYSNLQHLTVDTVLENLDAEEAEYFLEKKEFRNTEIYKSYCLFLAKGDYKKASAICKIESLSELLYLKSKDTFSLYLEYLKKETPELYKVECTKCLWNSMKRDEDFEKGLDYFLHLFIKNEDYAVMAPLDLFMKYASSCDVGSRKNIRLSILYYIYTSYFEPSEKDELSISCEDFFELNSIEKPSEMEEESENYNKELLIFFLRNVCVPSIMGPVLLNIRSTKELEQERILICQRLRELDCQNEEIYEQEIKQITHKLFLDDGVTDLETHKIQVDTEGIKARVSKELKSLFNKYMYSRNSKLDELLEFFKSVKGGENITLLSFDSSQILNEIVTTIRNEFVLGADYGLDSYLSLNIRHGTLTGQLRAPLTRKNMLAEKQVDTLDYIVPERWLYQLRDAKDIEKAKQAIIAFTEETDGIVDYLKKDLIQISTEEKPSKGIFDYALSQTEIELFQNYLTENSELEDFIDNVFDKLWIITEKNLEKMRTTIRETIKQKYIDAFAKLQDTYKSFNSVFPEANQWIKEAQNDMDAELEKISEWFRRTSEGQYSDFDLDSACQVGLQTIKNIHPSMKFNINYIEKNLVKKIDGDAWKSFASIFGILFDNISRYAKVTGGIKNVDCILRSDDTGVYIKMYNQIDAGFNLEKSKEKIESAMDLISDSSYLARAKQEGGSGIPKIYKMLAIDLNMKPSVRCELVDDYKAFQVEIGGEYQCKF